MALEDNELKIICGVYGGVLAKVKVKDVVQASDSIKASM